MKASAVRALAREWAAEEGGHVGWFLGAHLAGGLAGIDGDEPFAPYRDVDVVLITAAQEEGFELFDVAYRGLSIDYKRSSPCPYLTAEAVLAEPSLAPNLAADSILLDPSGSLRRLHHEVAAAFGQRRWVRARCQPYRAELEQAVAGLAAATDPANAGIRLWQVVQRLASLIALSHLENPTCRRSLIQLRRLLAAHAREDLFRRVLELTGFEQVSPSRSEALLAMALTAFDAAASLPPQPANRLEARVRPTARQYVQEGALEMIRAGDHREALHWILVQLAYAVLALEQHGDPASKPRYRALLGSALQELGLLAPGALAERGRQAAELAADILCVVDESLAHHPGIFD